MILESQGKLEEARPRSGAERWPFPWKFQGEGVFFEVLINKSGRVDTSMSPICASPKFRPNSVVELLGHEIHTCNVHQGWCQGSVLQFPESQTWFENDDESGQWLIKPGLLILYARVSTYSLLIWERWRKRAMIVPGVWRTPSRIKIS